jgi:hypothetical protein
MKFEDFESIVVIDDDKVGVEISRSAVEGFGIPIKVIDKRKGKFKDVNQLLSKVFEENTNKIGVVCDHQLMRGALADFYGSELVAGLYKQKVPAILVTQYTEHDIETSIREFRRWTPALIKREQLDEDNVKMAFNFCNDELFGFTPASRLPHRTLLEITSSSKDGEDGVAEAIVHGWDPEEKIGFPISLIPEIIKRQVIHSLSLKLNAFVFAEVNLGAERSSELYFDSFEWAERPKGLTLDSLFTNS